MSTGVIHVHRGGPLVALVGNPNCGKTALFNRLTGSRQKVANYAGVTVERKIGAARLPDGRSVAVIDLPGTYSLQPATPDEQVTLEVIEGRRPGEDMPDALVVVVSEESGKIRLAERGRLTVVDSVDELDRELMSRLNPEKVKAMAAAAAGAAAAAPQPASDYNPANDATNAFEPINEPLNLDDAGADKLRALEGVRGVLAAADQRRTR